jgi:hypothetical protein
VTEPTCDPNDLPDRMQEIILRNRGGCRCADPGAHPPCWACTEPATAEEVMDAEVEWIEERQERAAMIRAAEERDLQAIIEADDADARAEW